MGQIAQNSSKQELIIDIEQETSLKNEKIFSKDTDGKKENATTVLSREVKSYFHEFLTLTQCLFQVKTSQSVSACSEGELIYAEVRKSISNAENCTNDHQTEYSKPKRLQHQEFNMNESTLTNGFNKANENN